MENAGSKEKKNYNICKKMEITVPDYAYMQTFQISIRETLNPSFILKSEMNLQ